MLTKFEEKIINLIPSNTVKKEVKRINHHFSEIELVHIIINFSIYWNDRLTLLEEAKENISNKNIIKYINSYIKEEKKGYELLIKKEDGFIYEVDMEQDSPYEKYLVPDFDSAFITINSYIRKYKDLIDNKKDLDIEIRKRKIAVREKPKDIDDDEVPFSVTVDYKGNYKRIYSNLPTVKFENLEIEFNVIVYPPIFKQGDLVYFNEDLCKRNVYRSDFEYSGVKKRVYAINSFDNGNEDEACLLFLNSEYVFNRQLDKLDENGFSPYLMDHIHLDYGYLEKVDLNELPQSIKEDYEYTFKEYMKLIKKR